MATIRNRCFQIHPISSSAPHIGRRRPNQERRIVSQHHAAQASSEWQYINKGDDRCQDFHHPKKLSVTSEMRSLWRLAQVKGLHAKR